MVFVSQFEYNDAMSDDWDLEVCSFDNSGTETTSNGLELNSITDELINKSIDYGATNGSPITFDITLIHRNDKNQFFNRDEIREISNWLLTVKLHWLKLYDLEYDDYWCLGRFTKISKTKFGGNVPAITLTFVSLFNYYYSDIITKKFSVSGTSTLKITSYGDEIEGYMYPNLTIKMKSAGSVSIKNKLDDKGFVLSNLLNGEIIKVDGYNLIIYSSTTSSSLSPKVFGDNFNRHWLKLYRGENTLEAKGNFDITFEYREARRIGEF